ncbi:hypothetical protein HYD68_01930 [Mycoplasmopsis bovis]|nr:hypothetical protein [Mycoplasmopsis bovis]QQH54628.1 hypothetical protein HYD68_01930 [Mycoplasmopsis bovis]
MLIGLGGLNFCLVLSPMIATSCGVKKKDVETSRLKKNKEIQKPNSESNMQKIKIQEIKLINHKIRKM